MTVYELNNLSDREYIIAVWGKHGEKVVVEIDLVSKQPITMSDFLNYCTACGGNWGGMLLSGIRTLYPTVWDVIPDDMGIFAWEAICAVCRLLNIST